MHPTHLPMRNALLITALSMGSMTAHAQAQPSLPDAGSVRQQIETQQMPSLPQQAAEPGVVTATETPPPTGLSLPVKAFRLVGNSFLTAEQLAPALKEFEGRTLDFAGLQRASDAVAAAYREAGWIVRVYLPEQDVSQGIITLQVVEARFAGTRFEGQASQRVQRDQVEAFFARQQSKNAPLNANSLDRALLLSDDLPGISVAGTLAPGVVDGETALVLQTTDEAFVFGDVTVDNTGARSTGKQRLIVNLNLNSPGQRGELLSLTGLHTQGSDYGRVAFTVPDGHNGLRLGINASSMHYRLVDGDASLMAMQIKGRSSSLGMDWSYPLVRSRLRNLYFTGGLENKHFFSDNLNSSAAVPNSYSDYDTDSLRLGLSGNRFDNVGGGGTNSLSVQMLWGRLSRMQAHNQIDSIARAYNKINYSASRQQTLSPAHSLQLSLQGQMATQVLDSSERMFIGGANSVRAYPVSELGGERGQVVSAQWHWRLNPAVVLSAFVDHGRVVDLPDTRSEQRSSLNLRGHGLSASWQAPKGVSTKLTWSHRAGSHPSPLVNTGTDGDGTRKLDRFWVSASVPF